MSLNIHSIKFTIGKNSNRKRIVIRKAEIEEKTEIEVKMVVIKDFGSDNNVFKKLITLSKIEIRFVIFTYAILRDFDSPSYKNFLTGLRSQTMSVIESSTRFLNKIIQNKIEPDTLFNYIDVCKDILLKATSSTPSIKLVPSVYGIDNMIGRKHDKGLFMHKQLNKIERDVNRLTLIPFLIHIKKTNKINRVIIPLILSYFKLHLKDFGYVRMVVVLKKESEEEE